jgi:hypothetical protein
VVLGDQWYKYVTGAIVGVVGVVYVVLEYIPSIEPPANMRYVALLRNQASTLIVSFQ